MVLKCQKTRGVFERSQTWVLWRSAPLPDPRTGRVIREVALDSGHAVATGVNEPRTYVEALHALFQVQAAILINTTKVDSLIARVYVLGQKYASKSRKTVACLGNFPALGGKRSTSRLSLYLWRLLDPRRPSKVNMHQCVCDDFSCH